MVNYPEKGKTVTLFKKIIKENRSGKLNMFLQDNESAHNLMDFD